MPRQISSEETVAFPGFDLLQQPARFASREKGINRQTGPLPEKRFQTLFSKPLTKICGPAALPDYGRSKRSTTRAVPRQDGLPLVRNRRSLQVYPA